jgi:hypothetical protein
MNFFTMKTLFDMVSLTGWVLVCAALMYGLEVAGLHRFLTTMNYRETATPNE